MQPYWPALFASTLGKNVESVIFARGAGAAPAASSAPAAASGDAAPAPAAKAEKPKVEEVDALEGGMSMFGASGGGDY